MFRWTLLAGLVLVLAVVNGRILQTERQLREGELVYLQLAPVDPRSLMQGDYMALNFALANAIRRAEHSGSQVGRDANNGRVIVRLDAQGVARFVALDDGRELAAGQRTLRYRQRKGRVRFATDAYFFQEGTGARYEAARYGAFRVNQAGAMLLVGLHDEQLQRIRPQP